MVKTIRVEYFSLVIKSDPKITSFWKSNRPKNALTATIYIVIMWSFCGIWSPAYFERRHRSSSFHRIIIILASYHFSIAELPLVALFARQKRSCTVAFGKTSRIALVSAWFLSQSRKNGENPTSLRFGEHL